VNAFEVAALALVTGFAPLLWVCLREREIDGVVALELAGSVATLVLLCLAEGYHRGIYMSVAVVCAAVSWISGVVFARFLGRL
jgi:multisubunit Na+/H+ antiporter MnhF subunit